MTVRNTGVKRRNSFLSSVSPDYPQQTAFWTPSGLSSKSRRREHSLCSLSPLWEIERGKRSEDLWLWGDKSEFNLGHFLSSTQLTPLHNLGVQLLPASCVIAAMAWSWTAFSKYMDRNIFKGRKGFGSRIYLRRVSG